MSVETTREAVFELRQYLSDRLAPLMVADSMATLLQHPAEVMASEIQTWVAQQRVAAPSVPISDFIFHAVKKIFLMGEFDLVPRQHLKKYLSELSVAVLPQCPEDQRDLLRQNLDRLGQASLDQGAAAAVEVVHMQGGGAPTATRPPEANRPPVPPDVAQGLHRLSLFLDRMQPQAPPEQRSEVASQFITQAAAQSKTHGELDEQLARLKEVGIEGTTEQVFKTLAGSLPGWGPLPTKEGAPAPPSAKKLEAMRQIVSLAGDPVDAAKRFREMVHAAIEQFNEGSVGRAVTVFELAEKLVAEQKVQAVFVETMRKSGHEYLNAERLNKLAEKEDSRVPLRTVLNFFWPLQPEGLLKDLNGEPRRERRHELLALLEVHGPAARAKAAELLRASVEDKNAQVDPFFQMNLVYLLRVIPRPEGAPVEAEVNLVTRVTGKDSPPPLVKQVIAYLAQTKHDKAERALITYLRVFENMLLQPETAVYDASEIDFLLERTCGALARYASPRAWKALVDHGLKAEGRLGSSVARLVEAGRQDLSGSKDLVKRLLTALKESLPKTVLGFTVKKDDERITYLVQALAGTPTPEVKAALKEIVDKYPEEKSADEAKKALAAMNEAVKAPETAAGLSGDLELFGLPGVVQTLAQSRLTGVLNLLSPQGKPEAMLLIEEGLYRGAQAGRLKGEEAVYQLFVKPFPGTFSFVSRTDVAAQKVAAPPQDFMGLILEGARRYDEFKQAAAIVPDPSALEPTGAPHTPLPEEGAEFIQELWKQVTPGRTPLECEAGVHADSYRVRRLLAHWVEEGALKIH